MNFQSRDSHSSPLPKSNHILKREDKVLIEIVLFINKSFSSLLRPTLIVGSTSALITKKSHLLLIKYLNQHIEVILTEKTQLL